MPATTARTRRGDGYASDGAVRQGGSLPVYICNACGAEVVWVESKRTGRRYLANVSRGYHDQRFYVGANVHPRDCGEQKAQALAEWTAEQEGKRIARERTEQVQAMKAAGVPRVEILALIDSWA